MSEQEKELKTVDLPEPEAQATETSAPGEAGSDDLPLPKEPATLQEEISRLEAELADARALVEEYKDRLQRLAAESQNVRKRQEVMLQESIERAAEGLIVKLLPVLDDFQRAFENVPATLRDQEAAWIEGFHQIYHNLVRVLEEEGLRRLESQGAFDPYRHDAISHEPAEGVESGQIIQTVRAGYEYKGKVIRPALVRVAQ